MGNEIKEGNKAINNIKRVLFCVGFLENNRKIYSNSFILKQRRKAKKKGWKQQKALRKFIGTRNLENL